MAYAMVENDIKNLEFQTIKIPYEMLNKKFRQTQKNIDREVMKIQASVKELEKLIEKKGSEKMDEESMDVEGEKKSEEQKEMEVEESAEKNDSKVKIEQVKQVLQANSVKLVSFTKKLMASIREEKCAAEMCKTRLQQLDTCCQQLKQPELASSALNTWKKKQLDKMLVEYFLRSGYYDTAVKLARHSGIEDLTNMAAFSVFREIEIALDNKDTSKCLVWCADNKSKLRKIKSKLESKLRQQDFVELVKQNKSMEAVMFAQKHFSTLDEPREIQQCMGLLIFPTDCPVSPYKHLLQPERWEDLKRLFRKESYRMYQLNEAPILSLILQTGLSALKTPMCFKTSQAHIESVKPRKTNCPVCLPSLKALATKLPYALFSHSRLICFGSGQPMNEHNLPLMLPNGYVYGTNYLSEMAEKNSGQVTCPRTNKVFQFKEALKDIPMRGEGAETL